VSRHKEKPKRDSPSSWARQIRSSRPALIVLALVVALIQLSGVPEKLSKETLDAALILQNKQLAPDVSLVDIDDEDYAHLFHSKSPLDPVVVSQIIDAVVTGGARVVVVDLETSDSPLSEFRLPRESPPIVWAAAASGADGSFVLRQPLGGQSVSGTAEVGVAQVPLDSTGVVRSYVRGFQAGPTSWYPSLPYAAWEAFAAKGSKHMGRLPTPNELLLDYQYRFRLLKARVLMEVLKPDRKKAWIDSHLFANNVVIIGGTFWAARDQYATPVGLKSGMEIVAQATQAEIRHTGIKPARKWSSGLVLLFSGLIIVGVYRWFQLRTAIVVSLVLIPVLSIVCSYVLFSRLSLWFWTIPVTLAVLLAQVCAQLFTYLRLFQQLEQPKTK